MNRSTKQLTVSALLFALGLVLPFLTGQVPQIGNMLLPMHFPVFLCGWQYALFLGFLLPICRSHDLRHATHVPRCHCHGI